MLTLTASRTVSASVRSSITAPTTQRQVRPARPAGRPTFLVVLLRALSGMSA
jgi:hypothetical protein